MTKQDFLTKLAELYSVANRSDTECREDWTHPDMAGPAFCAAVDKIRYTLAGLGVMTREDEAEFIDQVC